jgi:hypothetical protein
MLLPQLSSICWQSALKKAAGMAETTQHNIPVL